jgi:SAM-dependent methyltransferase
VPAARSRRRHGQVLAGRRGARRDGRRDRAVGADAAPGDGHARRTPGPRGSPRPGRSSLADAACAASAFHWFDGRRALVEIHRALRRGGRLALVWNHRDDAVDWVARLSEIVNRREGSAPRYRTGAWRAAFDGARDLFRPLEEARFRHTHALPAAGVVERIASVSFVAAMPEPEREGVLAEVRALLAAHPATAAGGELPLAYLTDVFLWERI